MSSPVDDAFRASLERETEHQGESFSCFRCKQTGNVGTDMGGGFSMTTQGNPWFWWIHNSCAEEYLEEYRR